MRVLFLGVLFLGVFTLTSCEKDELIERGTHTHQDGNCNAYSQDSNQCGGTHRRGKKNRGCSSNSADSTTES